MLGTYASLIFGFGFRWSRKKIIPWEFLTRNPIYFGMREEFLLSVWLPRNYIGKKKFLYVVQPSHSQAMNEIEKEKDIPLLFPRSCTHKFWPHFTHTTLPSCICHLYPGFQDSIDKEKWKNEYWGVGSGSKLCLYHQILRWPPREN